MPTSFLWIFLKVLVLFFFFLWQCLFSIQGNLKGMDRACCWNLQDHCISLCCSLNVNAFTFLWGGWKNCDFATSCTFITLQSWSVSKAGRFIAAVSPCGLLPKQMWPTEFWLHFWCKQILTKQNTNKLF